VRYVLREFSALPIAAWMLWFLIEISRLHGGSSGYRAHLSWPFVVFSVVCLLFALWHTWTFLGFSGLIMRIPLGEGFVPARVVRGGAYALFLLVSLLIGSLVVWGGTR